MNDEEIGLYDDNPKIALKPLCFIPHVMFRALVK